VVILIWIIGLFNFLFLKTKITFVAC